MTFDLEKMIGQAKTVGIAGHVRPDGDAVGSCLGLGLYLEEHHPEIQTKVFLQDFQDCFLFLKGADKVCRDPEEGMNLDLFFCLSTLFVLGEWRKEWSQLLGISQVLPNSLAREHLILSLPAKTSYVPSLWLHSGHPKAVLVVSSCPLLWSLS